MWYKIDINKLVVLLTPTFLRKESFLVWLQTLVTPIASLHQLWLLNRENNLKRLQHNGQICYLRKALNDAFDTELRRITLAEGNRYTRKYIYTNIEQQAQYLGTKYLRQSTDYADTGVDFRIVVPQGFDLTNNKYQLQALVDFYKLAGKRYIIEVNE